MLLNSSSPREKSIPHAKRELMPHQAAMARHMRGIESRAGSADFTPFGLLSSSVGSGKTYVVISMCLMDKYRQTLLQRLGIGRSTDTTMVVVPSHLYTQWSQELEAFAGDSLDVFRLQRYEDVSKLYQVGDGDQQSDGLKLLHKYDVFLVSDLFYHLVATTCNSMNISFKRLVIDEADSMRNVIEKTLPAAMTWFVSASIHSVFVNDALVLGNAYTLSLPQLLQNEVRCAVAFVQESIALPAVDFQTRLVPNATVERLAAVLSPPALAGVNGCDSMAAIGKNIKNDGELLEQLVALWREQIEHEEPIVAALQEMLDGECGADEDELESQISEHSNILQKACASLEKLGYDRQADPHAPRHSATMQVVRPKLTALRELLKERDASSIVVFSEYPRAFEEVIENMDADMVAWTNVDCGTEKAIAIALRAYKAGETRVVLLHSAALSCGMNLENTSHIVFMHRVADALKFQVVGRGQRLGRTAPLTVVELLHANEAAASDGAGP
jgi:hypothetical protein